MSLNINQIYMANPALTLQSTDLFYLGRSPYGLGNDMACTLTTFLESVPTVNWFNVTTNSQNTAPNSGYVTDNGATVVVYTLPAICPFGSIIEISGMSSGLWSLMQNAGQQITFGDQQTTLGAGGALVSTNQNDYVKLLCTIADTKFNVIGAVGNIQYI